MRVLSERLLASCLSLVEAPAVGSIICFISSFPNSRSIVSYHAFCLLFADYLLSLHPARTPMLYHQSISID